MNVDPKEYFTYHQSIILRATYVVPASSKDVIPIAEIYRGGILLSMMSIMISFLEAH